MSPTRKFRFGVQLSGAPGGAEWAAVARRAEDLGYSTLFVPDHFGDQLAPMPALVAAAAATRSLRVGTLVLDNDFRHPVVTAMEAATVDVLTGGRLELGLGAGWMRSDYDGSGIPYDPPAVRIDRFEEGLAVVKGLLGPDPFTFEGRHYRITAHDGRPKPRQQPRPPIVVGGGGRRILSIAAREADVVGVNFDLRGGEITPELGPNATAEATEQKVAWIRDAAPERFDEIELNVVVFFTVVTDDRDATAAALAGGFGISPAQALDVPHALVGSHREIGETLQARRDRFGFSYVVVQGVEAMEGLAPVVAELTGT